MRIYVCFNQAYNEEDFFLMAHDECQEAIYELTFELMEEDYSEEELADMKDENGIFIEIDDECYDQAADEIISDFIDNCCNVYDIDSEKGIITPVY